MEIKNLSIFSEFGISVLANLVVCANPINSLDKLLIPDIILLVLSLLSSLYLAANQLNKKLLFMFFNNIASDLHGFCDFMNALCGFMLTVTERYCEEHSQTSTQSLIPSTI